MVRPVCFFLALALNHTPARSILLSKRMIKRKMAYRLKFRIAGW
jgi:hypothetical protein